MSESAASEPVDLDAATLRSIAKSIRPAFPAAADTLVGMAWWHEHERAQAPGQVFTVSAGDFGREMARMAAERDEARADADMLRTHLLHAERPPSASAFREKGEQAKPLVTREIGPGMWSVQEKAVPGFRLSQIPHAPASPEPTGAGEAVRILLESDALTPNEDGTPTHYIVMAENVEYLVRTVLAAARPVLSRGADSDANAALHWLSMWIDAGNADRDDEARTWGRLAKITEEAGEVIAAFIGQTGQNPRKGVTHTSNDVQEELLDVAVTALGAVAHLHGNDGEDVLALLRHKIERVAERARCEVAR